MSAAQGEPVVDSRNIVVGNVVPVKGGFRFMPLQNVKQPPIPLPKVPPTQQAALPAGLVLAKDFVPPPPVEVPPTDSGNDVKIDQSIITVKLP